MAEYGKQIAIARMDGQNEVLVTLEAMYNDPSYRPGRGVKVWEWNGFGFGLVYALEGSFNRIEIFEDRIHSYLVLS